MFYCLIIYEKMEFAKNGNKKKDELMSNYKKINFIISVKKSIIKSLQMLRTYN